MPPLPRKWGKNEVTKLFDELMATAQSIKEGREESLTIWEVLDKNGLTKDYPDSLKKFLFPILGTNDLRKIVHNCHWCGACGICDGWIVACGSASAALLGILD